MIILLYINLSKIVIILYHLQLTICSLFMHCVHFHFRTASSVMDITHTLITLLTLVLVHSAMSKPSRYTNYRKHSATMSPLDYIMKEMEEEKQQYIKPPPEAQSVGDIVIDSLYMEYSNRRRRPQPKKSFCK